MICNDNLNILKSSLSNILLNPIHTLQPLSPFCLIHQSPNNFSPIHDSTSLSPHSPLLAHIPQPFLDFLLHWPLTHSSDDNQRCLGRIHHSLESILRQLKRSRESVCQQPGSKATIRWLGFAVEGGWRNRDVVVFDCYECPWNGFGNGKSGEECG